VRTVAIDPGKHNVGIAIFQDAILDVAYLLKTSEVFPNGIPAADEVVVEKMQVYRGSIAAPLVELAIISSEIAGAIKFGSGARSIYYLPSHWKGQLGKDVCHARARAALAPFEIARIELPKAKKTQLDVMDAVALGLFHLRKTNRRR
jgi:hypothetical protein